MNRGWLAPGFVALVSAGMLLGALGFQYLGELPPCPLCHLQRYPYIATLALGLAGLAVAGRLRAALVLLSAIGFAVTGGIGAYHAGVEYGWWAGPDSCTGTAGLDATSIEDLRAALEGAPVVRCDDVAWSLAGISMAGYNTLIAAGMTLFCAVAGLLLWRRR
ncbi:MAG: disulfide bond formation protein B [Alphaproteobacteria bacterium]